MSTATAAPFTLNVIDVAHDGTRTRSGKATGDAIVTVSFVESLSGYVVSCRACTAIGLDRDGSACSQSTSDGTNRLTCSAP